MEHSNISLPPPLSTKKNFLSYHFSLLHSRVYIERPAGHMWTQCCREAQEHKRELQLLETSHEIDLRKVMKREYNVIIYMAGNFRGRKLSQLSRFFSHPRKFSPRNSRHATPIMQPFHESFLHKMLLSYRSAKLFSLENFPLYGT